MALVCLFAFVCGHYLHERVPPDSVHGKRYVPTCERAHARTFQVKACALEWKLVCRRSGEFSLLSEAEFNAAWFCFLARANLNVNIACLIPIVFLVSV